MTQRDLSFLRRPKWIVGHVIVIIAVVVFVSMGFWQLRRLADRQDFNTILTSRAVATAAPLDEVLETYGPSQDDLELRNVVVTGSYRSTEEIILLSKSFRGLSGHHVLTPLYLSDGSAVVVDRGWVPIDLDQPGLSEFAPPEGEVTIVGVLRKTQVRGSFGPVDPPDGVLDQIARVDVDRISQQTAGALAPVWIQLLEQTPVQPSDSPAIVELPEPSEGPHRGYAVQWFLFTAVVAVGYPTLLWRTSTSSETPSMPSSAP